MSKFRICIPAILAILAIMATQTHGQSSEDDEDDCIISDTECTCTMVQSSGSCMRHQGGGACLMGECNEGYKCDCMGFEKCNISTCAIYTTALRAVPSDVTPFSCELTPDAGKCTTFGELMGSVTAADNAKSDSTISVQDTTKQMLDTMNVSIDVIRDKQVVDEMLAKLDKEGHNVTEEERAEVDKDANEVTKAVAEVQAEMSAVHEAMSAAFDADLESAKARRSAQRNAAEAKTLDTEKRVHAAKPENKSRCVVCEKLKEEIKLLRKKRREAAIAAGTWAKKAREARSKGRKHAKRAKKVKLTAEEARKRCMARARKILKRLRS